MIFNSLQRAFGAAAIAAVAIAAASCGDDKHSYVANLKDPMLTPTMVTTDVATFISDSGYTRYHIETPVWQMFEDLEGPFWKFPSGLDLEQYDLRQRPQARMRCDSATYFSRRRLWRLDGHVVMINTMRDTFLTEQLFWDQNRSEVYSDSFIHIVRSSHIIEGYGFTSNQNMTAYTVNRPTAIIPLEGGRPLGSQQAQPGEPDSLDAVAPGQRRAPSARHRLPNTDNRIPTPEP